MSADGDAGVEAIPGVGPSRAANLRAAGYETVGDVRNAGVLDLIDVEQVGRAGAKNIIANASDDDGEPARGSGSASKLTRERQEEIAAKLERAQSIAAAARTSGITRRTFYNWIERGADQEQGPYREFYERMRRARGVGERRLVEALLDAIRATNDTRTLLEVLRIRYPESWGDRDPDADDAGTVNVHLSPEGGYRPPGVDRDRDRDHDDRGDRGDDRA